jgi:hypothetical protein
MMKELNSVVHCYLYLYTVFLFNFFGQYFSLLHSVFIPSLNFIFGSIFRSFINLSGLFIFHSLFIWNPIYVLFLFLSSFFVESQKNTNFSNSYYQFSTQHCHYPLSIRQIETRNRFRCEANNSPSVQVVQLEPRKRNRLSEFRLYVVSCSPLRKISEFINI